MTSPDVRSSSNAEVLCWLASRDVLGRGGAPAERWHVDDVDGLIAVAEAERLLGPLLDAALEGEVEAPEPSLERLVERHSAAMAWCVLIEARLLEVRSWFDDAGGVEHRVIKGAAVAHLDESDPAKRSFADLDLLVAADVIDRAVGVLEARGAKRPWPQRRPGFDRRFAKSVTLTCPDGIEIDVHRTLCDGVHGVRVPLAALFEQSDSFELGGESVLALTAPHRMLHAAYHAVLGSHTPRLMSLRDLARYMDRLDLSPDVIAPIARSWRGEAVLAAAVDVTSATLGLDARTLSSGGGSSRRSGWPAWLAWSATIDVSNAEAAVLAAQQREGSSFGRGKLKVLRELSGFGQKVAYGRAVAWPSADHLAARGLRRSDALRSLAGLGRRPLG